MTSQDDLGMLWYGVPGLSYNNADPAEVMINAGAAAPLLSEQPRGLIATPDPQLLQSVNTCQPYTYGDPNAMSLHPGQIYYDPNSVECLNQSDGIYETYEGYDDDSCAQNAIESAGLSCIDGQMHGMLEDDGSALPKINKKPKVHHNPALKLKTPIAYQRDTDRDAIPIMKEGMAICERCGAIGVKHAFYGKDRKYCSLGCARGPNANSLQGKSFDDNRSLEDEQIKVDVEVKEQSLRVSPVDIGPDLAFCPNPGDSGLPIPNNDFSVINKSQPSSNDIEIDGGLSYNWETMYLLSENFRAAPVQAFPHVPMSECWQLIGEWMKVEVSCKEDSSPDEVFWVATVISVSGYKAKLRYEGCLDDSTNDFWVDICSNEVHPVGWCASQGNALIPPKFIQHKYSDWKDFLMKRLTGARTLATSFHSKILESQRSRFRVGLNLEVVDKNRIAQMRVATVTTVVGNRLYLKYHGASQDDSGFWCHEDSPLIHPVGWSREVGHEIVASQSYHEKCMQISYDDDDATEDLFIQSELSDDNCDLIRPGMKLEALDPLNLSKICVASVMKVLANNFLMIKIDSYEVDSTGSDWFCYHASSPYVFPCGFCEKHKIDLSPPKGCLENFNWQTYLHHTGTVPVLSSAFSRDTPPMEFEIGMSLEAVDLMDPRLVCVAKIIEIKERLLKIHFDGWDTEFDQWVDCESPDIYPVGWCDLVKYRLEGPREDVPAIVSKRKVRGSKKVKQLGRGVENASPPAPSIHGSKKGRRGRGGYSNSSFNQMSPTENRTNDNSIIDNCIQPIRRRRGRPKKIPLQNANFSAQSEKKTQRTTHNVNYPNYEDGEASDHASSGVASLAESEVSNEYWDQDALFKMNNPRDVNLSTTPSFNKDNIKCDLSSNPDSAFDGISSLGESSLGQILLEEDECKHTESSSYLHCDTNGIGYDTNSLLMDNCGSSLSDAVADHLVMDEDVVRTEPNLPRIIEGANCSRNVNVQPSGWTAQDVATFLTNNDCGAYCLNFISQNVDGSSFLSLTQNDLMSLTKMKVGPSIKIHALIQQLIAIVNPAQARYQATLLKKKSFS